MEEFEKSSKQDRAKALSGILDKHYNLLLLIFNVPLPLFILIIWHMILIHH